ncbi:MAG: hypothetical protein Q4B43_08460 [Bacteroidota bacterium]|uniref:Uncharacterized protein n=1 Tax=Capnocytophaga cynodegmi TaxID=28189 RepID=A0A0B7H1L8_9FLAO|nr:hypothetical protein [Capnocytophaga cynodegmi]MDO4729017.1 hypothetical protein [Bacteroidota bacterium]GIM54028.1 hypothetical protein CAPN005_06750 [Capnocytophaga cynodegmi]CEN33235.1 conserved hypothetical protein [Capnocytophaga cynodegmi]
MTHIKTTEFKALYVLGEIVRNFEKLHFLQMQDNDREQLQKARKILERIIHKNGYRVAYRTQQAICKK